MTTTTESVEPAVQSVQRSVTFDVFPPKELYQSVLASIRKYRAVCRQVYATLLLAQTAGATMDDSPETGPRLTPINDQAKIVLAAAVGSARIEAGERVRGEGRSYQVRIGSALAYELRGYVRENLWPTCLSFVWDSIRRDVSTVWTSLDPEHTRAQRGWLALQGARGVAQFNWRGIGVPRATGRPKLEGYELTLKWDHELGTVTFKLPHLDGGRSFIWAKLRDGDEGWSLGTLYLNERDGRIKVTISYAKPATAAPVDPERVCRVAWAAEPDFLCSIRGPEGEQTFDAIYAADAVQWLQRHEHRKQRYQAAQAACGSPSRPWGNRTGWRADQKRITRLTLLRENTVKTMNHAWSRRIVARALSWRCGEISVAPLPKTLGEAPWKWSQFVEFLKYKAGERGILVNVLTETS